MGSQLEASRGSAFARYLWYGLIIFLVVGLIAYTPWDREWAGLDFSRYLAGARGLFDGDAYHTGFVYSPAFALLVSPLTLLPFDLALTLWRVAEIAALIFVLRGAGPVALLVFVMPWLWASEMVAANMMGFGTALMIAVVRWPSIRTVAVYAAMIALVPKPGFLPVLLYGVLKEPRSRGPVVAIGLLGFLMLAWPGYVEAMLFQTEGPYSPLNLPEPWAKLGAVIATGLGLVWPRLLGVASVLAMPYVIPYMLTPLGLFFVPTAGGVSERLRTAFRVPRPLRSRPA